MLADYAGQRHTCFEVVNAPSWCLSFCWILLLGTNSTRTAPAHSSPSTSPQHWLLSPTWYGSVQSGWCRAPELAPLCSCRRLTQWLHVAVDLPAALCRSPYVLLGELLKAAYYLAIFFVGRRTECCCSSRSVCRHCSHAAGRAVWWMTRLAVHSAICISALTRTW